MKVQRGEAGAAFREMVLLMRAQYTNVLILTFAFGLMQLVFGLALTELSIALQPIFPTHDVGAFAGVLIGLELLYVATSIGCAFVRVAASGISLSIGASIVAALRDGVRLLLPVYFTFALCVLLPCLLVFLLFLPMAIIGSSARILYLAVVIIPTILLFIYLRASLFFYELLILTEQASFWGGLRASFLLTRGRRWRLGGTSIVFIGLVFAVSAGLKSFGLVGKIFLPFTLEALAGALWVMLYYWMQIAQIPKVLATE